MSRQERRIYAKCIAIMAAYIIAGVYFYTLPVDAETADAPDLREKAVFTDDCTIGEYFIDQTAESPENGKIREMSGMPCENREQFERWYATYEQATGEETEKASDEERSDIYACETDSDVHLEENLPTDSEMETEAETETAGVPQKAKCYSVNGELIDPIIQQKLHDALEKHGIGYWFEGALCQMYQESRGQQYAVNPHNGIDCGLYQYRSTYWNGGDIFDVDAQIERYSSDMAARFNSGLSVDEAISRHNTSDHVEAVNWEYVSQVKQWLPTMRGEN